MADTQVPALSRPAEVTASALGSACPVLRDPEVCVLANDSGLAQAYEELRVQYQRCATALATAAHDLRTPLAVLSGYVELLISGKLGAINEKQHHVLQDMQVSSKRLQRLVTDFLTFASLQTGNINLRIDGP